MKFTPNSLILDILSFWYSFTVSDPFPLKLDVELKLPVRSFNWREVTHFYNKLSI